MRAVLITGPPGSGKTSVLTRWSTRCPTTTCRMRRWRSRRVVWTHPALDDEARLRHVRVMRAAAQGRPELLLVADTVETEEELAQLIEAVDADEAFVVRLRAEPDTLAERIIAREPPRWSGLAALVEHARAMAPVAGADLELSTEGRDGGGRRGADPEDCAAVTTTLPTSLVGSYAQPDWLIDREKLAARFPPRVRALELWRVDPQWLEEAQDDATLLAIRDQERAGLDIVTDGEMRRESYSNRFANALTGIDLDNPGTALDRSGHPNPVPRVVGPIERKHPVQVRDLEFLKANTDRLDQDHRPGPVHDVPAGPERPLRARRRARARLRRAPSTRRSRDLFAAGADIVQIDEPYMQARPEKAREYGRDGARARARRPHRHDRRAHLLRLRRDHPRAPEGYSFLTELAARRLRPDLDRDRAVEPRRLRCSRGCRARRSSSACSTSTTTRSRRPRWWPTGSGARCPTRASASSWPRPTAG